MRHPVQVFHAALRHRFSNIFNRYKSSDKALSIRFHHQSGPPFLLKYFKFGNILRTIKMPCFFSPFSSFLSFTHREPGSVINSITIFDREDRKRPVLVLVFKFLFHPLFNHSCIPLINLQRVSTRTEKELNSHASIALGLVRSFTRPAKGGQTEISLGVFLFVYVCACLCFNKDAEPQQMQAWSTSKRPQGFNGI